MNSSACPLGVLRLAGFLPWPPGLPPTAGFPGRWTLILESPNERAALGFAVVVAFHSSNLEVWVFEVGALTGLGRRPATLLGLRSAGTARMRHCGRITVRLLGNNTRSAFWGG